MSYERDFEQYLECHGMYQELLFMSSENKAKEDGAGSADCTIREP